MDPALCVTLSGFVVRSKLMIDERIPFLADLAKVTARQIGEVLL